MADQPPLFDPTRHVDVDPRDAVRVAHAFMQRCRTWAVEVELPKRRGRVQHSDAPEHAAKLHGWLTYLAFLDHTLAELEDGTLDHWFEGRDHGGTSADGLL